MPFQYPENYSTLPVQHKIHLQLARHTFNIQKAKGYNNDVVSVFTNAHDFENAGPNFPACNIIWGPEDCLDAHDIDRSTGLLNFCARVFFDWILSADNDPSLARARIKADCLKYFTQDYNYWLPEIDDSAGTSPTCFNFMFASFTPHGDNQSIPQCKLEMEAFVWYRTQLGNPYQVQ